MDYNSDQFELSVFSKFSFEELVYLQQKRNAEFAGQFKNYSAASRILNPLLGAACVPGSFYIAS